jgi:hypothetical protein
MVVDARHKFIAKKLADGFGCGLATAEQVS